MRDSNLNARSIGTQTPGKPNEDRGKNSLSPDRIKAKRLFKIPRSNQTRRKPSNWGCVSSAEVGSTEPATQAVFPAGGETSALTAKNKERPSKKVSSL